MSGDEDVAAIARGLTGHDADMIANAWQGASGRWYIDGRCKHLYPEICSLSGVLQEHGLAVREHLIATATT